MARRVDLRGKPDETIALARETGFNVLIVNYVPRRTEEFAKRAREQGIETFIWYSTDAVKAPAELRQVMSDEENKLSRR